METEKKNFVVLKSLFNKEDDHVYDSPKKAVGALDDLGLCMNWATLTQFGKNTFLFYQGWVYKHSPKRYVALPFNEDEDGFEYHFTKLLKDVFVPFINVKNEIFRSTISVTPHASEKNCFFVTPNLFFWSNEQKDIFSQIREVLHEVCDSNQEIKSEFFGLD